MRKKYGKKNGVIPGALLDYPEMERKEANSKKNDLQNKFYRRD